MMPDNLCKNLEQRQILLAVGAGEKGAPAEEALAGGSKENVRALASANQPDGSALYKQQLDFHGTPSATNNSCQYNTEENVDLAPEEDEKGATMFRQFRNS